MSLIVAVYVPTGIVLSGDSRTTGTASQQVPNPANPGANITVQTSITLSDATNKIFLVDKKFGVGTFGEALVQNMPIAHYIGQFQTQAGRQVATTTQGLATGLLQFFRALNPVPNVGLIVMGYDSNDPWVVTVDVSGNAATRRNQNAQNNQIEYGILRGGDTAIVDRLLSQAQFNPPFQIMNLQDGIDFSRHLIRATIDQMRFEPGFATVGGSIDTLVVTAAGAQFLAQKSLTAL